MRVVATVKNQAGELVGTLQKEDFEVYDNGVPQEIAVFERQTDQPLSVALLIDTSGSTAKELKYETDSASRFLNALLAEGNPEDAGGPLHLQLPGHLRTVLHPQLRLARPPAQDLARRGRHGALRCHLPGREQLEDREGRKVIVVVTDGGDTTQLRHAESRSSRRNSPTP